MQGNNLTRRTIGIKLTILLTGLAFRETASAHRQDVGEDGDDGRVQVCREVLGLHVGHVHHLERVGAGVGQLVVGDQEEGDSGAGSQEQDQRDDDLLGDRGARVVAVLALLAGLERSRHASCVWIKKNFCHHLITN